MNSDACRTRGNTMKLKKFHTLSARDGHFFSNRVVNVWNSPPDSVILSPTVSGESRNAEVPEPMASAWSASL